MEDVLKLRFSESTCRRVLRRRSSQPEVVDLQQVHGEALLPSADGGLVTSSVVRVSHHLKLDFAVPVTLCCHQVRLLSVRSCAVFSGLGAGQEIWWWWSRSGMLRKEWMCWFKLIILIFW